MGSAYGSLAFYRYFAINYSVLLVFYIHDAAVLKLITISPEFIKINPGEC